MDAGALVSHGQLTLLDPLMTAPAFDTPGKTVLESLLPSASGFGLYDGKRYGQSFIYGVTGIWYSKPLMDQHGWEYPKTWDQMIALCGRIKAAGIAPWTFQGRYPGYMGNVILAMAQKSAGTHLMVDVDNLTPNIWRNPAFVNSAAAVQELILKKYILEGSAGLTHTQSQTYWAQRKAVFIPCGSWLENELGSIAPKDLGMAVGPTPSLAAGDQMPFETIQVNAGTDYVVPAQAKNPLGAMELLRIMLSKRSATDFSMRTKEQLVVADYADKLTISSAFSSRTSALTKAGANVLRSYRYTEWYPKMAKDIDNATSALLINELTPAQWGQRCQAAADATAKDSTIKKYKRDA
jgi:N-acetylglucosamine transport system substrate-binding protein